MTKEIALFLLTHNSILMKHKGFQKTLLFINMLKKTLFINFSLKILILNLISKILIIIILMEIQVNRIYCHLNIDSNKKIMV